MSAMSPLKTRMTLSPLETEALRRAASYAVANWNDLQEAFNTDKPKLGAAVFDSVLKKVTEAKEPKRLLAWKPIEGHGGAWEAVLGSEKDGDGARISLEYVGTCYRRGRWKMLIEVFEGARHHDWGCFDAADQPTRNYHVLENAIEEAEAIAAVLVADRMERGSIAGWVPNGEGKEEGAGQ